jgi:predicted O-methyltransferase YrrM
MDDALLAQLDRLHREGAEFDAAQADRLDRLRNLEPETGRLLAVLIRALRPKRLLEIGTSNGYSTLWLADAARSVGGALVSVEVEEARTEAARANLAEAGLAGVVELRVEDAAETLAKSEDGEWGFVLLDAERPAYAGYWPELRRALAPGGLVAVDNALSHADEVAALRALVERDPSVVSAVDPVGAGVLFVTHAG